MSMTYWGFPVPATDHKAAVVLLANPGLAGDKLRQAIVNAGGQIVLEAAPAQVQAAQVLAASPAVVVIALDASTDQALDVLEPVLDQAGVMVLLEEADLAAQREGWDAQRWERHLAAKLQGHANVLPPGAEQEQPVVQPAAGTAGFAAAGLQAVPSAQPGSEGSQVDQPSFDAFDAFDYDAEPVVTGPAAGAGVAPSLDDLLASAPPAPEAAVAALAGRPAVVPPPLPPLEPEHAAVSPPAPPVAMPGVSQWSLVDFDSSAAEPVVAAAPAAAVLQNWDLSNLSLLDPGQEDDAPGAAGAVSTVALVMAGIGGPDAIRRLLSQLPAEGMPGAVLIQLRLDGGRYANLVSQLARVCAAPLQLAEAGKALEPGHVYVIADDITVSGGQALRFDTLAPMASVLADLPAEGSAVLMLSGADADQVDAVLRLAERGAWVAGQSGEGCYDPAAASALAVAGMPIGEPAWLARELLARWGL